MNKNVRYTRFLLGLIIVSMVVSCFSPYLIPHDPNLTDISIRLQAPSMDHLFGTDAFGRDLFSRTLLGSRVSVLSSLVIVVFSGLFGSLVGMLSGYYGGRLDQALMGVCDIFLAFPQMILAIGIAGIAGGGLRNAIIALTISNWMQYARLARSATLREKERLYVASARMSGLGTWKILFVHILANIKEILLVTMAINFSASLISLAGLSFLGIGVQPPSPEWGAMINEGRLYLSRAPWICFFPTLGIMYIVFLFNLFGYSLQKKFKKEGR